jgi:hypothetical protein
MPPITKKAPKRERKLKTVKPVAVLDIDELDKIITAFSMLMNKENETAQSRININHNAKKLQAELKKYRRHMTEYYKLAD